MKTYFIREDTLTSVADAIREKTGDTATLSPIDMATEIPKVYEKGFSDGEAAENSRFWNVVLKNRERYNTQLAFNNWACEYIRPPYMVVPTYGMSRQQTFSENKRLKKVEKEYFDFSKVPYGSYASNGWYYTFSQCSALEEVEDIGMTACFMYTQTFSWCGKLHTIAKLGSDKNTKFDNTFKNCGSLVNITIDGVIGQDINFQYSPLDVESALSVMRALRNFYADFVYKYADPSNPESNITEIWLDEDGDGEGDIYVKNVADGDMYYTFPTIYFSEATIALLDSTDFSTYPEEELPFNAGDGWRVGVESKGWNVG